MVAGRPHWRRRTTRLVAGAWMLVVCPQRANEMIPFVWFFRLNRFQRFQAEVLARRAFHPAKHMYDFSANEPHVTLSTGLLLQWNLKNPIHAEPYYRRIIVKTKYLTRSRVKSEIYLFLLHFYWVMFNLFRYILIYVDVIVITHKSMMCTENKKKCHRKIQLH